MGETWSESVDQSSTRTTEYRPEWQYPAHKVRLTEYYIGQFEMTRDIYFAVLEDLYGGYYTESRNKYPICDEDYWFVTQTWIPHLNEVLHGKESTSLYPLTVEVVGLENLSEQERKDIISRMEFSLPTEAQWEYAARGGVHCTDNYVYSGSNDFRGRACTQYGTYDGVMDVGSLLPNQLGLYDMSGNVAEYCKDIFLPDFYEYVVSDDYDGSFGKREKVDGEWVITDPYPGTPADIDYMWNSDPVIRGGHFFDYMYPLTVSYRSHYYYGEGFFCDGFRLVLKIK